MNTVVFLMKKWLSDETVVTVNDGAVTANPVADMVQCDADGSGDETFDLTSNDGLQIKVWSFCNFYSLS